MALLYISYSDNDNKIAAEVARIGSEYGFKTFKNVNISNAAEESVDQIASAINNCAIFVFIVSKTSLESQWCRREVEFAIKHRKEVLYIISDVSESLVSNSWIRSHIHPSRTIRWGSRDITKLSHLFFLISANSQSTCVPKRNVAPSLPISPNNQPNQKPRSKRRKGCIWSVVILLVVIIGIFTGGLFWLHGLADADQSSDSYDRYDENTVENQEDDEIQPEPFDYDSVAYDTDAASDSFPYDFDGNDGADLESYITPSSTEFDEPLTGDDEPEVVPIQDEDNTISPYWWLLIGGVFIIGYFFFAFSRKKLIKIVADRDCDVFIDNKKVTSLSGCILQLIKLKKGTYYIVFRPKDPNLLEVAQSYRVTKSNELISITFEAVKVMRNRMSVKCFIAGSTHLEAERDALRAAIAQTHNQWAGKDVEILSYTYEDFQRHIVEGGHQKLYDDFIKQEASIAVFVISGEIGKFTITEFDHAFNAFKAGKHPQILVFNNEHAELHHSAKILKDKIIAEKQYWVDYDSLKTLKLQFMSTLNWLLIDKYVTN